jgi:hypothetical protein
LDLNLKMQKMKREAAQAEVLAALRDLQASVAAASGSVQSFYAETDALKVSLPAR